VPEKRQIEAANFGVKAVHEECGHAWYGEERFRQFTF
jgi:hypothetical protein